VTTPAPRHRHLTALLLGVAAALLLATPALGHASLVSSNPGDGASVPVPSSITLTFEDTLDAARSGFQVVDLRGAVVATGDVVATDAKTIRATGLTLALGPCQVKWTAIASDGDLTRGTVSFTVIGQGAPSSVPARSRWRS
jgi:methionine-rich copper-binding protein CopC